MYQTFEPRYPVCEAWESRPSLDDPKQMEWISCLVPAENGTSFCYDHGEIMDHFRRAGIPEKDWWVLPAVPLELRAA